MCVFSSASKRVEIKIGVSTVCCGGWAETYTCVGLMRGAFSEPSAPQVTPWRQHAGLCPRQTAAHCVSSHHSFGPCPDSLQQQQSPMRDSAALSQPSYRLHSEKQGICNKAQDGAASSFTKERGFICLMLKGAGHQKGCCNTHPDAPIHRVAATALATLNSHARRQIGQRCSV